MFGIDTDMDDEQLGLTILKVIGGALLLWGGHHMGSTFFSHRDQAAQVERHFDASGAKIERIFFGTETGTGPGLRKTRVTVHNGTAATITYLKGQCDLPAGTNGLSPAQIEASRMLFDAEELSRIAPGQTVTVAVKAKNEMSGQFWNSADLAKYRCTSSSDFDIKDQTKAIGYVAP